jgi:signal transduction histidine kinase
MRNRAEQLQGCIRWLPRQGGGTRVELDAPLPAAPEAGT